MPIKIAQLSINDAGTVPGTVVTKAQEAVAAAASAQSDRSAAEAARDAAAGHATAAASSAASAASVVQQDLSAISLSLSSYTPVDLVVGSMASWSDGGAAMRRRQGGTSWYNEPRPTGSWLGDAVDETAARAITGAGTGSYYHNTTDGKFYSLNATSGQTEVFRGNKAGFPEEYVVVAEANRVIIFDATDPDLPMWMVFDAAAYAGIIPDGYGAFPVSSIAIHNGVLLIGQSGTYGGMAEVHFTSDTAVRHRTIASTNGTQGHFLGRIVDRATAVFDDTAYQRIGNENVNDVAITVLPDAPIDTATGMPVPTIALATQGGVSVIKHDGTVANTANTVGVEKVKFAGESLVWCPGQTPENWFITDKIGAVSAGWTYTEFLRREDSSVGSYPRGPQATTPDTQHEFLGNYLFATSNTVPPSTGLFLYKRSLAIAPDKNVGAVAKVLPSFCSGWMPGDIRGAWLADTTAETITGSELVTGDDSTFATSLGNWTPNNTATLTYDAVNARLDVTAAGAGSSGAKLAVSGLTVGKSYTVTADFTGATANYYISALLTNGSILKQSQANATSLTFEATETTHYILVAPDPLQSVTIDNVSVRLADPDRSVKNNGLQVFGSLAKVAVATGADLVAHSGFSVADYLQQPYNADLDFGTGDFCVMGWIKNYGAYDTIISRGDGVTTATTLIIQVGNPTTAMRIYVAGSQAVFYDCLSGTGWDFVCITRVGGLVSVYVNGVLKGITTKAGSITQTGAVTQIGVSLNNGGIIGSDQFLGSLALLRIGATAPSAGQIKHIYETEKVLFQEGAKCTLFGSSDAITAMAHDPVTGLLHVGTSDGRSTFSGLRRVAEDSTPITTAIGAHGGLIAAH